MLITIQYFSIGGDKWDHIKTLMHQPSKKNLFKLKALHATVISTEQNKVSVTILQCTSLKLAGQHLEHAPIILYFFSLFSTAI